MFLTQKECSYFKCHLQIWKDAKSLVKEYLTSYFETLPPQKAYTKLLSKCKFTGAISEIKNRSFAMKNVRIYEKVCPEGL